MARDNYWVNFLEPREEIPKYSILTNISDIILDISSLGSRKEPPNMDNFFCCDESYQGIFNLCIRIFSL